jgi:hypothetical protein
MQLTHDEFLQLKILIETYGYCCATREERIAYREYKKKYGVKQEQKVFTHQLKRWSNSYIPRRKKNTRKTSCKRQSFKTQEGN